METRKPVARTEELGVEEIGDELLVYDQRSDQAHCLGSAAARVWRACDGTRTVEEFSVALTLEKGTVAARSRSWNGAACSTRHRKKEA